MTSHLTGRQISELLIDGGSLEHKAHLENCGSCAREVAELRATLAQFRGSVRSWSSEPVRTELNSGAKRGWDIYTACAVASVFVLLLAIAGIKLAQSPRRTALASGDTALLDQVRLEVSRPAPSGMAPLLVPFQTPSSGSTDVR